MASSASAPPRNRSFSNNGSNGSNGSRTSRTSSGWPTTPTLDIKNGNAFSNGASSGNSGGFAFESPNNAINEGIKATRKKEMMKLLEDTMVDVILPEEMILSDIERVALVNSVVDHLEKVTLDKTGALQLPEDLGYTFVKTVIRNINKNIGISPGNRMAMFELVKEIVHEPENVPNRGPKGNRRRKGSRKDSRKGSRKDSRRHARNTRNTRNRRH
jgi:hypothetical protein